MSAKKTVDFENHTCMLSKSTVYLHNTKPLHSCYKCLYIRGYNCIYFFATCFLPMCYFSTAEKMLIAFFTSSFMASVASLTTSWNWVYFFFAIASAATFDVVE